MSNFLAWQKLSADDLNTAFSTTDWASYNPNITNGGTATFTTMTGRWRRVGTKTVVFGIFFIINAAGSGGSNVLFDLPTAPSRAIRWQFPGNAENAGLSGLYGLTFTGGSGVTIDRIRYATATNLIGTDLTAGRLFGFDGTYEEL
jgi:hypothetical protein